MSKLFYLVFLISQIAIASDSPDQGKKEKEYRLVPSHPSEEIQLFEDTQKEKKEFQSILLQQKNPTLQQLTEEEWASIRDLFLKNEKYLFTQYQKEFDPKFLDFVIKEFEELKELCKFFLNSKLDLRKEKDYKRAETNQLSKLIVNFYKTNSYILQIIENIVKEQASEQERKIDFIFTPRGTLIHFYKKNIRSIEALQKWRNSVYLFLKPRIELLIKEFTPEGQEWVSDRFIVLDSKDRIHQNRFLYFFQNYFGDWIPVNVLNGSEKYYFALGTLDIEELEETPHSRHAYLTHQKGVIQDSGILFQLHPNSIKVNFYQGASQKKDSSFRRSLTLLIPQLHLRDKNHLRDSFLENLFGDVLKKQKGEEKQLFVTLPPSHSFIDWKLLSFLFLEEVEALPEESEQRRLIEENFSTHEGSRSELKEALRQELIEYFLPEAEEAIRKEQEEISKKVADGSHYHKKGPKKGKPQRHSQEAKQKNQAQQQQENATTQEQQREKILRRAEALFEARKVHVRLTYPHALKTLYWLQKKLNLQMTTEQVGSHLQFHLPSTGVTLVRPHGKGDRSIPHWELNDAIHVMIQSYAHTELEKLANR